MYILTWQHLFQLTRASIKKSKPKLDQMSKLSKQQIFGNRLYFNAINHFQFFNKLDMKLLTVIITVVFLMKILRDSVFNMIYLVKVWSGSKMELAWKTKEGEKQSKIRSEQFSVNFGTYKILNLCMYPVPPQPTDQK